MHMVAAILWIDETVMWAKHTPRAPCVRSTIQTPLNIFISKATQGFEHNWRRNVKYTSQFEGPPKQIHSGKKTGIRQKTR